MNTNINALDGMGSLLWSGGSQAVQDFIYSPYGGAPTRSAGNLLPGFNGERPDPISQTYHLGNGYRTYNPALMRFTAPDSWSPFGAGGFNAYAYCEGDPINQTDPSGHLSGQAWAGIGLAFLDLIIMIGSGGMAIAAAGGVAAAWATLSAADIVLGAAEAAADVAAIANGVTSDVNPDLSKALGWTSFALGMVSIALHGTRHGLAQYRVHAQSSPVRGERFSMEMVMEGEARVRRDRMNTFWASGGVSRTQSMSRTFDAIPLTRAGRSMDEFERSQGFCTYDTASDRRDKEVASHEGGIVWRATGEVPDDGVYSYVFSTDDRLYMSRGQRHSRFLGGSNVKSAGDARIKSGMITQIDSASGHYQPMPAQFEMAMRRAFRRGFLVSSTELHVFKGDCLGVVPLGRVKDVLHMPTTGYRD